eukprot:CAMPEP_0174255762 /NCGR_PEP_ID=MMETSP0439-20130205/5068_1 /TAXON_ID=0 /ORGANISM="Stereomyxa ramosa, Strain Chinc5" /LENGTH=722 /DNA_ID=CAMNT_0015338089 /DNA_START=37 /DNA_END=2205 /DNA_ORIENTATION=-
MEEQNTGKKKVLHMRPTLKDKKRILVKVGTCVVTNKEGYIGLARIGGVVEQICSLKEQGKEVVLVSSGAVAFGRQKFNLPNGDLSRVCASAGQSGLMGFYEILFQHRGVQCAQVLVTDDDFSSEERRENLKETLNTLLKFGAVPIINENDVISTRKTPLRDESDHVFWDNDSLSALIGGEIKAELVILLSDVEGLYKKPPTENEEPEVISTYVPDTDFTIGKGSVVGRGGMQAKVEASLDAINKGVEAVVIASGQRRNVILDIVAGKKIGTLFVSNPQDELSSSIREVAHMARTEGRRLLLLSTEERKQVLLAIADLLVERKEEIMKANQVDLENAKETNLKSTLLSRLKFSDQKLDVLVEGIKQIANAEEMIGLEKSRTELAENLILSETTAPIGVILVIFESRPDVLPQVVSLCIKTGNSLLLKGGKEALCTNAVLHTIIGDAIDASSSGKVSREVIGLVETREDIKELLDLDGDIDLIIPRGSSQLVRYIQTNTKIPVLGHAEGVCHVYVDKSASLDKAIRIAIDSKCDYPAACNAMETLLLHKSLLSPAEDCTAQKILQALADKGVTLHAGSRLKKEAEHLSKFFDDSVKVTYKEEYGDLAVSVECVDDTSDAVLHINTYGSGHTDSIVSEDEEAVEYFLKHSDSACVFYNASTRFADGFRFGLGAEVGISTGKIHARGPVGMTGLLTTKWKLISTSENGDVVEDFKDGSKKYTHKKI